MKLIIYTIRIILLLFAVAIALVLKNSFAFQSLGIATFGIGVIAIIWWVTVHLGKDTPPNYYLPKVLIFSGYLLSFVGLFHIFSFFYGAQMQISLIQALGALIGGVLIIRIGNKPEILNQRRKSD